MGILKKITKNIDALSWKGNFPVHYLYTVGDAGEKFFKNLKEKGVFTGAKCPVCSKVYLPPRIYCEECFEEIKEFPKLPLTGKIETFTIIKEDIEGKPFNERRAVAFVRIDGSCGGILGFIITNKPDDIKIGTTVKARLKSFRKRQGLMDDIEGFELIKKMGI